jgi:hypothetical protein
MDAPSFVEDGRYAAERGTTTFLKPLEFATPSISREVSHGINNIVKCDVADDPADCTQCFDV